MKRVRLFCLAVCLPTVCTFAATVVDLPNSAFDRAGTEADPVPGWKAHGAFKAVPGAGHNGSGGLVWSSDTPTSERHYLQYDLDQLKVGKAYRLSLMMMSENLRGCSMKCCLQWHGINEKGRKGWLGGQYFCLEKGSHDWTVREGVTERMPTNMTSGNIVFYIEKGATGRVVFDNVTLTTRDRDPVDFVISSAYRDAADAGKVRFHASFNPPDGATDLKALFGYTGADGKKRRAKPTVFGKNFATLELDVGELMVGRQNVICAYLDGRKILGAGTNVFTRVDKVPVRKTAIDRFGRCVVNGKPFFPLGFYGERFTEATAKDLQAAGCNTFMPYGRTTTDDLDIAQNFGQMLFADVRRMKPDDPKTLTYLDDIAAHPALLAWYTNDERPVTDLPKLLALYDFLRARDPEHFVWVVLDRLFDLREFSCSYDALGVDPYPIGRYAHTKSSDVAAFYRGAKDCVFHDRAFFNVPQMFSWNGAKEDEKINRFPTYEEIRSMTWQHLALGATWLCVCNLDEKAGATASLKVGTKAFRTELPPLGVVFKNVK